MDNDFEEFARLTGDLSNYAVSNMGRVLNIKTQKFLAECSTGGYKGVGLKGEYVYVHRLVAKMFLDAVDGKPEIDHIDRNKANNNITNLRYVSRRENMLNRKNNVRHRNIRRNGTKWQVLMWKNSKYFSKLYDTLEEAIAARDAQEKLWYPDFIPLS